MLLAAYRLSGNLIYRIKQNKISSKLKLCLHYYMDTLPNANKTHRKKLEEDYARMLRCVSNKLWKQHPSKQRLYSHQPPILQTIQVRRTRHAGHRWRSKDKFISDVLLWTLSLGHTSVGWEADLYQLFVDTGRRLEDLLGAMYQRDRWYYLPTPPLGQDMTQGQFLSGV